MSADEDRAPVSSEVSHPNSEPGQNAQHPPASQPPDSFWGSPLAQACLAVIYEKLGRHPEAQASFAKYRDVVGETGACHYACVLAQWNDHHGALSFLEKAARFRDPALTNLRTEPCFDSLRNEPRFQAIERALKFPN